MDAATISALAALGGATVGGVTSFGTTWLSQQSQARIQEFTHKLAVREKLFNDFIEEASKQYADALINQISDVSKLVALYSMINKMRVISSKATVESADQVARLIVKTYSAPNKGIPELEQMVNTGAMDILQVFSEAARHELHSLRS